MANTEIPRGATVSPNTSDKTAVNPPEAMPRTALSNPDAQNRWQFNHRQSTRAHGGRRIVSRGAWHTTSPTHRGLSTRRVGSSSSRSVRKLSAA
jgi:hypothetical protein